MNKNKNKYRYTFLIGVKIYTKRFQDVNKSMKSFFNEEDCPISLHYDKECASMNIDVEKKLIKKELDEMKDVVEKLLNKANNSKYKFYIKSVKQGEIL